VIANFPSISCVKLNEFIIPEPIHGIIYIEKSDDHAGRDARFCVSTTGTKITPGIGLVENAVGKYGEDTKHAKDA
jgi:hypothetical protein